MVIDGIEEERRDGSDKDDPGGDLESGGGDTSGSGLIVRVCYEKGGQWGGGKSEGWTLP